MYKYKVHDLFLLNLKEVLLEEPNKEPPAMRVRDGSYIKNSPYMIQKVCSGLNVRGGRN